MTELAGILDALSTQDFEKIVRDDIRRKTGVLNTEVQVLSTSVTKRPTSNGFMGLYFTLRVTFVSFISPGQQTFVYFVKTLPIDNPILMQVMRDTGMAEREHNTYLTLINALDAVGKTDLVSTQNWHPHCFYRNEHLLILEDLGNLGFEHVPNGVDFSIEHTYAALEVLADMHAASFSYEQITLKGSTLREVHSDLLTETSFVTNNAWFMVGLETIKETVPLLNNFESNLADRWNPTTFMNEIYKVFDLIRPSSKFRNVLCHQDLWSSNILFRRSESSSKSLHAKLIDFQCMRYLPPAADIMLLLHLSTQKVHRDAHLSEYLEFYHKTLSRKLDVHELEVDNFVPFTELVSSCRIWRLLALVNAGILLPWIRMPGNLVHNLKRDDYAGYEYMAYVRRIEIVENLMIKEHQYRMMLEEVVSELVQFVFDID